MWKQGTSRYLYSVDLFTMLFQVLFVVFVAVMVFLAQGLRVAFQTNSIEIEIPFYANISAQIIRTSRPTYSTDSPSSTSSLDSERMKSHLSEQYDWSPRPYEPQPRPPLEQIVLNWDVKGDPQWLLNFAITGFPKCGTSTLMHYFANNPEVHIHKNERCEIGSNQHVPLIRAMYNDFPAGDFVRGIKCPRDLENKLAMKNYEAFFPGTDMIIGIRHPVKWFESFYNHRIHNNFRMPNASSLVGACAKHSMGVCTNRASFHVHLAMLGKTPLSRAEFNFMSDGGKRIFRRHNVSGRVFLYEVDQLNDKNETRSWHFRKDLQRFLYLKNELPAMVWFKPGRKDMDEETLGEVNRKKIDICASQYGSLRNVLMDSARNASKWIRRHFISSRDVHVSSPDHLVTLLENWEKDPCSDGGSYKAATANLNCTKYGCFVDTKKSR